MLPFGRMSKPCHHDTAVQACDHSQWGCRMSHICKLPFCNPRHATHEGAQDILVCLCPALAQQTSVDVGALQCCGPATVFSVALLGNQAWPPILPTLSQMKPGTSSQVLAEVPWLDEAEPQQAEKKVMLQQVLVSTLEESGWHLRVSEGCGHPANADGRLLFCCSCMPYVCCHHACVCVPSGSGRSCCYYL